MKTKTATFLSGWRLRMAVAVLLISLSAVPLAGAQEINGKADTILKSMSVYLGGLKAFSMNADIDLEIVKLSGQKLQISSFANIIVKRPDRFHITRKGMISNAEFVFDGQTLTVHGKNLNAYYQTKGGKTIDNAIRVYESETGMAAPGADLLFADPYSVLSSGVDRGDYIGRAYVKGVECHHLAFRRAKTDWQIWIAAGDKPLPMKYVITTKWITGAPQYEIRLRDWNLTPKIEKNRFSFTLPAGAVKIEAISVDGMGEFTSPKDKEVK